MLYNESLKPLVDRLDRIIHSQLVYLDSYTLLSFLIHKFIPDLSLLCIFLFYISS